jgi:hypothetical protein
MVGKGTYATTTFCVLPIFNFGCSGSDDFEREVLERREGSKGRREGAEGEIEAKG